VGEIILDRQTAGEADGPVLLVCPDDRELILFISLDGAAIEAYDPMGRRVWSADLPGSPMFLRTVAVTRFVGLLAIEAVSSDDADQHGVLHMIDVETGRIERSKPGGLGGF